MIIIGLPPIIYYLLAQVFGHSSTLCLASIPSGAVVIYLWLKLYPKLTGSTKKWDWDKSGGSKETAKKTSPEKYSVGDRSTKSEKGIFSRIFSDGEECEECGTELVYKEGAGSYYCPKCQEYKWK